jgi:hypothetical protein
MSGNKSIWMMGSLALVALLGLSPGSIHVSWAETRELETFIRARIEIGEAMAKMMREQRPMDRSMEELRKMEEEINTMVARILESYGLTIQEYRERSPKVFEDKAEVDRFLEAHPDLKKRYEVLPLHQGGRPPGRAPQGHD